MTLRFLVGIGLLGLALNAWAVLDVECGFVSDPSPEPPFIPPSSLVHIIFWDEADEQYPILVQRTWFDGAGPVIAGTALFDEPDNDFWTAFGPVVPGPHIVDGINQVFRIQGWGAPAFHPQSDLVCEADT